MEFFHLEMGTWFVYLDVKPQYSRFLVTIDPRFHIIVKQWSSHINLPIQQLKISHIFIDQLYPKVRIDFDSDKETPLSLIYAGHSSRPYISVRKGSKILFNAGHETNEPIDWEFQPKTMTPSKEHFNSLTPEKWRIIFDRIAEPFSQKLQRSIKQKTDKMQVYATDEHEHRQHDSYLSFAEHLLTLNLEKMLVDEYPFEEKIYPVKRHLSSGQNATMYFKKAKKSRMGLNHVKEQREKNLRDIHAMKDQLSQLSEGKLDALSSVKQFLINLRLIGTEQKVGKQFHSVPQNRPYFGVYKETKLSFGKNQMQNDALTFDIASKKDFFFHIANQSGSHVILHHTNPSHELLLFTCQLVLFLAQQRDGEVHYTMVKYVKKTKIKGLVKLEKHDSLRVKLGAFDFDNWLQLVKRY